MRTPLRAVLVLGAISALVGLGLFWNQRPPSPPLRQRVEPHLHWADQESERVVAEHLWTLDTFFHEARKNTPRFAERVLSYRSKWLLIKDRLPFTLGKEHEQFIRDAFHEYLFSPEQLERVLGQVVREYLDHVRSIEGAMLVKIRADVADLPSSRLGATVSAAELRVVYDQAISQTMTATGTELQADVARETVALITGEVLTAVAVRLGISGGVLGAGAASSWATFGVGLVVGLIVDQVISWVWDWWADPQGALAEELNRKLDELHRLVRDGSDGGPGLRARLHQFARDRAVVRREAVLELLQPRPGGLR